MSSVMHVFGGAISIPLPPAPSASVVVASPNGLPQPLLEDSAPSDPLAEMMAMLERMNRLSTEQTEREIRNATTTLQDQLQKFMKLMADAIRRAQQAKKKKKKGFLGKVAGAAADLVGGAVGKALAIVTASPSLEKKIEGFTRGALLFTTDLATFSAKLAVALAADGPDAAKAWEDVKAAAKKTWESFQENCIENPDFMEVVGLAAKAGAVAAAIGSGGTLAVAAVVMLALVEVDKRMPFVEAVAGKDAAPWVRIGMNVAASALLGAAGGDGAIRYLTGGAAILQGASDVNASVKLIAEAKRQSAELRHQANLLDTLNRIHQLQRLIEELLGDMDEHAESRERSRTLSNGVVQAQGAVSEAVILRA